MYGAQSAAVVTWDIGRRERQAVLASLGAGDTRMSWWEAGRRREYAACHPSSLGYIGPSRWGPSTDLGARTREVM